MMVPTRQLLRSIAADVCVAPQLEPHAMADLAALELKLEGASAGAATRGLSSLGMKRPGLVGSMIVVWKLL